MKVLMVGPGREDKGGIATVVNQYYEANINKKVDIKYITTMHDGTKIKKILTAIMSLIEFKTCIHDYDIVHIHMSSRASYYRKRMFVKVAKENGKKIIIHVHGSEFDVFYNKECTQKQQKQIRKTFAMADEVIVLSNEWKEFFIGICDEAKIKVLHNAVVIPEYINRNISNHNMLFLGRLGERKGIYDLLKVMPKIVEHIPDVHLFYGGDGEIEQTQEYIEQEKIQNYCTYLGWIDGKEKVEMLKKCSVFVLPSYHEGMPMAILEAMSYGEIVVSTYVGGIPQVIKDSINGYLFEAGDIRDLESKLLKVFAECNKEEIAINAYEEVKERFNVEKNVETLCGWYKKLVQSSVFVGGGNGRIAPQDVLSCC